MDSSIGFQFNININLFQKHANVKDYLNEQFFINPILSKDVDGETDDSLIDVIRQKIYFSPPLGTAEDTWHNICNKVICEWFCKKRGIITNVCAKIFYHTIANFDNARPLKHLNKPSKRNTH